MRVLAALAGALAVIFGSTAAEAQVSPLVTVSDGRLRGAAEEGVESWKGIPFAGSPVGTLRWRGPQPVKPWSDVRDATSFQSDCPQLPITWAAFHSRTKPSEDCLYLNVFRPAGARGKLPVVVWIYGGGWKIGATSAPVYSGSPLARQGVVVATLNYRLGRFGWFAHPQLTRENADDGLFYNYGTLDQIAALRWIKRNIAAFGGDPDNITLMGESAGGVSIHTLITSPMTQGGLFHKAIIMSGGNGGDLGTGGLADAEGLGLNFARRKGIEPDDPQALAKLRALSTDQIADGLAFGSPEYDPPTFNGGGPIEDGKIVAKVGKAYTSGAFHQVPMMIGPTADDLGGRTGFMVAGARRIAGVLADKGLPVYSYRFSYIATSSPRKTADHATDVPFFLGTQAAQYPGATSATDNAMAAAIMGYVIQFAKADPRRPSIAGWPRLGRGDNRIMDFSRSGTAVLRADPWAAEIDAAPPAQYPGLSVGGARAGAPRTGSAGLRQPGD